MINLVIFDFDGTLVDTAPDLVRSANMYLESQGFEPLSAEQIRNEIGMGLRKLILDLYPAHQKSDPQIQKKIESEFLAVYEREYLVSPRLFEGAEEFLTEWDGQIAIVSNKRARFIHPILKKLGIDHLPWTRIVGGDSFSNMKPHPEPFLAAVEAAGVSPEETLIVGDGAPDVEGALAIGSRVVAVEFGYTPVEDLMDLGAWGRIEAYDDLLPLIKTLARQ